MADQEYDSAAASPPPADSHENGNENGQGIQEEAERSPVDTRRGEDSMMDRERSPAYGRSDDRDDRQERERTRERSPVRRPPPPPPGRDVSIITPSFQQPGKDCSQRQDADHYPHLSLFV